MILMKHKAFEVLTKETHKDDFLGMGFKKPKDQHHKFCGKPLTSIFHGTKGSFITCVCVGEDVAEFLKIGFVVNTEQLKEKAVKSDTSKNVDKSSAKIEQRSLIDPID